MSVNNSPRNILVAEDNYFFMYSVLSALGRDDRLPATTPEEHKKALSQSVIGYGCLNFGINALYMTANKKSALELAETKQFHAAFLDHYLLADETSERVAGMLLNQKPAGKLFLISLDRETQTTLINKLFAGRIALLPERTVSYIGKSEERVTSEIAHLLLREPKVPQPVDKTVSRLHFEPAHCR